MSNQSSGLLSFIRSFTQWSLRVYFVPNTMLATGDTVTDMIDVGPALHAYSQLW